MLIHAHRRGVCRPRCLQRLAALVGGGLHHGDALHQDATVVRRRLRIGGKKFRASALLGGEGTLIISDIFIFVGTLITVTTTTSASFGT